MKERFDESDARAEELYADRILYLMDEGDAAQDEQAIAAAKALHIGHVGDLFVYRAQEPAKCLQCSEAIKSGELFNSTLDNAATAHRTATCERCRPTTRKRNTINQERGKRAAIDANAGHDSGGTEREIRGASHHGLGPNPYKVAAQLLKRDALVAALQACNVTVEQVEQMTPEQWVLAARAARVNVPSVETQRLVIETMRRGERKTA